MRLSFDPAIFERGELIVAVGEDVPGSGGGRELARVRHLPGPEPLYGVRQDGRPESRLDYGFLHVAGE